MQQLRARTQSPDDSSQRARSLASSASNHDKPPEGPLTLSSHPLTTAQADIKLGWGAVLLSPTASPTAALAALRRRTAAGVADAAADAGVLAETAGTVRAATMKLRVQQEQQLWRRHLLTSGAYEKAASALDSAVAEAARSAAARAGMASEEGLVEQARFVDALKLQGADSYALDDSRKSGDETSYAAEAAGVVRLTGQYSGACLAYVALLHVDGCVLCLSERRAALDGWEEFRTSSGA